MNERKKLGLLALLPIILIIPLISTCNSSLALALDEKMESDDPSPPGFLDESGRTIFFDDIRATAVELSWIKAQDDFAEQNELEYCIIYSSSDNIDTPENALKNGTIGLSWTADISTGEVAGLTILSDYYFNVLVRDKAGNSSAYKPASAKTKNDTILPSPGGAGSVTLSSLNMEDFTVSWAKGSDDISPEEKLKYLVYYSTVSCATGDEVVSTGTAFGDWSTDISTIKVTGVLDNVTYYVTVVVADEVGNTEEYGVTGGTTVKHPRIFWTETSSGNESISRAELDGSSATGILSDSDGLDNPYAIAVDSVDHKIYWVDSTSDKLMYSNFDGSGIGELFDLTASSDAFGIAIDSTNRYLYWTDKTQNTISRSSLPPTSSPLVDLVILDSSDSVDSPYGIDVDRTTGDIFWVEQGATPGIYRSDYSAPARDNVFTVSIVEPVDIALDHVNEIIYWTDRGSCQINSRSYDSGFTTLISGNVIEPIGITLDFDGYMYWIDNDNNKLYKSKTTPESGSDAESYDILSSLSSPRGIEVY
ncbi:MAG: hypothetical protein JEZ04_01825 [Spirochaetales bacterium]|nr:hypothetical protein [Spirochaetales bacterium]